MNRIHRKIWSQRLGAYVVVAEIARSRGKSSGVTGALLGAVLLGAAGLSLAATVPVNTLPSGGAVVAGQAGISQSGNVLTVTQGSDKAAINWQSFSVGADAKVNFVQPSAQAVVLNRVLGSDVSVIQGSINANGQVFLVNPSGVLFTPTAQVNVGALVAATQNITTADFMAGNYKFSGTSEASVENQGRITAANGGAVALIAARVVNTGQITANAGQVTLAAANTVTLDLGGPVMLRVSEGALNAIVDQNGGIRANGGTIYLTALAAGKLAASVINHSGVTQAQTLADVTGHIKVSADIVSHTGQLDASSDAGRGGSITVNAGTIIDSGATTANGFQAAGTISETALSLMQTTAARLSADSQDGQGGSISLLGGAAAGGRTWLSGRVSATGVQGGEISASGNQVVAAGFRADSSGTVQAGRMRLGGGWQGKDETLANAQTTRVGSDVQLSNQGAGGRVVVWSEQQTTFSGRIDASNSAVEVSGKESLTYAGTTKAASLLLDPQNITIENDRLKLDVLAFREFPESDTGSFGTHIVRLDNGNVVITAPTESVFPMPSVGAVHLFSPTGALISSLVGSADKDYVGSGGVTPLSNGNFVVNSTDWFSNAGAITLVNGSTGLTGVVSRTNSLTGAPGDSVGSGGVTALTNGNYVVNSPHWGNNGTSRDAGAVTWGSGTAGVTGFVSSSNSLAGTTASEGIGSGGITALTNGGYVVVSPDWGAKRGAVTWVSGSSPSGVSGPASSSNSLIGQYGKDSLSDGDRVGSGGLAKLNNGKYVILSPGTNSAAVPVYDPSSLQLNTGAVTWVDPEVGVKGVIGATNSMVGSVKGDRLGSGGIVEVGASGSGNFVVISPYWNNGFYGKEQAEVVGSRYVMVTKYYPDTTGAVTFVNGNTGMVGLLSASNSLVENKTSAGGARGAGVGGVTVLANGNYVALNKSGATWANGDTGVSGSIDETNSLIYKGPTGFNSDPYTADQLFTRVSALNNGNYVVTVVRYINSAVSPSDATGAVAWGGGTSGLKGILSSSNALIGTKAGDFIGIDGIKEVGGGNFVVLSPRWNSYTGAATWISGTAGLTGAISSSNSLVGAASGNQVGTASGFVALSNGNYVLVTPNWNAFRGAVTWGSGTAGVTGVISSSNSLVGVNSSGNTYPDQVGRDGVTALTNGNYVVNASWWGESRGAVTWGNGATGTTGEVTSANSFVGNTTRDHFGRGGVVALTNGNYVVLSPDAELIKNGAFDGIGAVTWGNGQSSTTGNLSNTNSLVGTTKEDSLGSGGVKALSNGNYVVLSPNWKNGNGAATWGDGTSGVSGFVSADNSLIGDVRQPNRQVGLGFAEVGSKGSGNFLVNATDSVTWVSGSSGLKGVATSENSLVGTSFWGTNGLTVLPNGNYVINGPYSVSWGDGNSGARGVVDESNSLLNITGRSSGINANTSVVSVKDGQAWVKAYGPGVVYRINGGTVSVPSDTVGSATFANDPAGYSTITPAMLKTMLDNGTAVTLQANNDITLRDALTVSANGHGGALTLLAGRNISINAALTTDNGNFTAVAGSTNADLVAANKQAGEATLTISPKGGINAGTGTVTMSTMLFDNQNTSSSTIKSAVTYLALPSWIGQNGLTNLTLGGLKQDAKRYNSTYDESTATVVCKFQGCVLPTNGFNVLYGTAPNVLVRPDPQAMTYGEKFSSTGYTLSGLLDGDSLSTAGISGTPDIRIASQSFVSGGAMLRAGTYDLMYWGTGIQSSVGYTLTPDTTQKGQLVVFPYLINSIVGLGAVNKPYDGTTAAKLNLSYLEPYGKVKGDDLTVNSTNAVGTFEDKQVGWSKVVKVSGITLTGTDAANYRLGSLETKANIRPPSDPKSAGATPLPGTAGGGSPGAGRPNTNPGNAEPNPSPAAEPDPEKKKNL